MLSSVGDEKRHGGSYHCVVECMSNGMAAVITVSLSACHAALCICFGYSEQGFTVRLCMVMY